MAGPAVAGHFDACKRSPERCLRSGKVKYVHPPMHQSFCSPPSFFCASKVDLLSPLRRIGEHCHLVSQHLHDPTADSEIHLFFASPGPELAGLQEDQEGCVVRQDAQLTIDTGREHYVHVARIHQALCCDNLQL